MDANRKEKTESMLRRVLAALQVADPGGAGNMDEARRDLEALNAELSAELTPGAEIVRLLGQAVTVISHLPEGSFQSIHRAAMDAAIAMEAYLASADFSLYDGMLEDRAATLRNVLAGVSASKPEVVDDSLPGAKMRGKLEDLATQLILAGAGDRAELVKIRGSLSKMIRTGAMPEKAKIRAQAAWIALGTLLAGESQDAVAELAGIGRELEEAMSACVPASSVAPSVPSGGSTQTPARQAVSVPARPTELPPAASSPNVSSVKTGGGVPAASGGASAAAVMPADIDPEMLNLYVAENLEHIQLAERALLDLESNPNAVGGIDTVFRAFHTIKGTSGVLGFPSIQDLAHLGENLLDDIRKGRVQLSGGLIDLALESCDVLKAMIHGIETIQPGAEIPQPAGLAGFIRRLGARDTSRSRARPATVPAADAGTSETAVAANPGESDSSAADKSDKASVGLTAAEATARVSTSHLDRLMDMVGELVIAHASIAQDEDVNEAARPRLARNVTHAGKIIRDLQAMTMSLRMVPLRATFQKMERLVRNLIRNSGKPVRFVTEGEDTEIDRHMVDTINDPLVHILRNALDHGLESARDRVAAGKESTGEIRLRAYHSAGSIVLEIGDNGRGLQRERIFAKALELGWVSPGQELPDSELFAFLYKPGFTTAQKVTDISGRGVGMDVVKRSVETLRGRVELGSAPGEGTTVTLRLPLTMAVVESLVLRVGSERYLLPTFSVLESLRPSAGMLVSVTGQGEMIQWREHWVPVVRLHRVFGVNDAANDPARSILVIVESSHQYHALMVDELIGRQEAVVKSLGAVMGCVPGVSGGTIMGDGRVGLILDVNGIVSAAQGGPGRREAGQAEASGQDAAKPVAPEGQCPRE